MLDVNETANEKNDNSRNAFPQRNCRIQTADVIKILGRTIAQAVSRRLPTATARVRAQVKSCGICGGQSGTRAGFLRVLRFPLPSRIPPIAPQ
jgi:hypothetical protein